MKQYIIVMLVLAQFIIPGHIYAKVLDLPLVFQEQDQWCWAAVSTSILSYYNSNVEQCEVAEYARVNINWRDFGSVNCCIDPSRGCNYWNYMWGYPGSIEDILRNWNVQVNNLSRHLSVQEVVSEINSNKPFIIRWGLKTGGGHFINGYGIDNSMLSYMDPWFGEGQKTALYSWVVSGGNHDWTHTQTMKSSLLNDTGIQFCGEATSGNNDPCTGREPQGQDAHYGRDAAAKAGTLTKVGAGVAGFDFTKISNSGQALPATASLGSGPNDWACTLDNVTGIMWEVKVNDASHLRHKDHSYSWYFTDSPDGNPGAAGNTTSCSDTLDGENCNTENYAAKVNTAGLCGFTDWRVPPIKDLESIVNQGRRHPAIDTDYFPYTASSARSHFWSASPNARYLSNAWYVGFGIGYSSFNLRSYSSPVRLARGGQWLDPLDIEQADFCKDNFIPSNPDSAYTDHGDGTVTDVRTGITWKRCSEGQTWDGSTCTGYAESYTWAGALRHAQSVTFAGHSDWRVPNIKELHSIMEECRATSPMINPHIFPETLGSGFWSSSPYAFNSNLAWNVWFYYGYSGHHDRTGNGVNCVRLARGGQLPPPPPPPAAWKTEIGVINPNPSQMSGTLRGFGAGGNQVWTRPVTLGAHGRLELDVTTAAGSAAASIKSMRLDVTSGQAVGYQKFYQAGQHRVGLEALPRANQNALYLPHIHSDSEWWTGVGLVNTTTGAKNLNFSGSSGLSVRGAEARDANSYLSPEEAQVAHLRMA